MSFRLASDAKWSETRLWDLIEQRTHPDADVEKIDQRVWDLFGEEWAIVFTDLSGFSRRAAEFGILHFLQVIHESHKLLLPAVVDHDGILVKSEADSYLLLFKRPERALECAIVMQHTCQQTSKRRRPEEQILLCVGIGYGKILRIGDTDVYGEQVNVASKLGEDTARGNEILISKEVQAAIGDFPDVTYEPLEKEVSVAKDCYRVLYPLKT
jgi:adenylate cyclase